MKTAALESDDGGQEVTSLKMFEELYLCVRPGGLEEQQTLVRFLRHCRTLNLAHSLEQKHYQDEQHLHQSWTLPPAKLVRATRRRS